MRETIIRAVRADGSPVEVRPHRKFPDGREYEGRIILDRTRTARIVVDSATQSVTTYPLTQNELSINLESFGACKDLDRTSARQILGYEVFRREIRRDAGPYVLSAEEWVAPALNCFPLVRTSHAPNSTAYNTENVTAIVAGAPPADYFVVPANFAERSPSQVAAEYARRFPNSGVPELPDSSDTAYNNANKRAK